MSERRGLSAAARVAVAVLGVLALGVLLVSTIAYVMVRNATTADLDSSLLREAQAYGAAMAPATALDQRGLLEASRAYLAGRATASGGLQPILLVRMRNGKVLSNSSVLLEDATENGRLLDPRTATKGFSDLPYGQTSYRVATVPVTDTTGTVLAVFQAAAPTAGLSSMNRDLVFALVIACFAAIGLGTGLSFGVAHRALRPLHEMAESASRVTHRSLTERIGYGGPADELGQLAESLDSMLDRLEASFGEQRRFVADASHELRTPLAVIRGNLDIIRQPWADDSEREESLRIIDDEVCRMQRLLDDMLALARSDSPARRPFQPLELSSLLAEAVTKARSLGPRRITVSCSTALWVIGDPDALEQALLNVLRNAVQHTGSGGEISVRCSAEHEHARIEIADDGPGLKPEDADRVFDRFYRASGPRPSDSGGSGLGLSITRRLLEQHSGSIEAIGDGKAGARFVIRVPLADSPE
ncbi:MAG: HAMP domain-containing sensor histidine kinase [Actinomycetota bacterium]|nr:HAMP domain-containing sensor histidine kinase [Actinomycetota bacterium]